MSKVWHYGLRTQSAENLKYVSIPLACLQRYHASLCDLTPFLDGGTPEICSHNEWMNENKIN